MGAATKIVVLAVAAIGGAGCAFTMRMTGGPVVSDTGDVGIEGALTLGLGPGVSEHSVALLTTRMGVGKSPEGDEGTFHACMGGDYVHESPGDRSKAFRAGGAVCARREVASETDYLAMALSGAWYPFTYVKRPSPSSSARYLNLGVELQSELLLDDNDSVAGVWTSAGLSIGVTTIPAP